MTAAFFIALREGLEAALIVGIVAAYLVKIGRRDALPGIWAGVVAALSISIAVGVVVVATVGKLPIVVQEGIEGVTAIVAVGVLGWMLFWMRRQGRALKGDLERGVDNALAAGGAFALAGLAFVAVAREGLETVLYLFAIGVSSGPAIQTVAAILAGLAIAGGIGWAIFAAGIRIDLRRFFTVTGIVLIFVSAGLMAFAVHAFGEAGLIANTGAAFNIGAVLPESSPLGAVLAGLFGYRSAPTPLEVIAYLAYLVPVLYLFVWGGRTRVTGPATAAAATILIAFVLVACSGGGASQSAEASGEPPAGSGTTVEVGASEYRFDPNTITVAAGQVTFEVTNNGTEEHEFEVFKGDLVVDEVEGLVPGLTRTLPVTLEAGDYTFACKLAGHDLAGMTGTLTVTGS
jgi:high-affinity iron transporter